MHHSRQDRVLWPELKVLMPAAIVGVGAGAALAHDLPADVMRVMFGGFFMFMGILLARKGWAVAKKNRKADAATN